MKPNQSSDKMPELLSAKDMSEHLGVSLGTCYKLLKQDDLHPQYVSVSAEW